MRVFVISCAVIFVLITLGLGLSIALAPTASAGNNTMSTYEWIRYLDISYSLARKGEIIKAVDYTFIEAIDDGKYKTEIWKGVVRTSNINEYWTMKISFKIEYDRDNVPRHAIVSLRGDANNHKIINQV